MNKIDTSTTVRKYEFSSGNFKVSHDEKEAMAIQQWVWACQKP